MVADGELQFYTTLEYKKTAIDWRGMNTESRSESEDPGAAFYACASAERDPLEGPSMIVGSMIIKKKQSTLHRAATPGPLSAAPRVEFGRVGPPFPTYSVMAKISIVVQGEPA